MVAKEFHVPLHEIDKIPEKTRLVDGRLEVGYWTAIGFLEKHGYLKLVKEGESNDDDTLPPGYLPPLPSASSSNRPMERIESALE